MGHQLAPIWDAGVTDGGSTCWQQCWPQHFNITSNPLITVSGQCPHRLENLHALPLLAFLAALLRILNASLSFSQSLQPADTFWSLVLPFAAASAQSVAPVSPGPVILYLTNSNSSSRSQRSHFCFGEALLGLPCLGLCSSWVLL